MNFPKFFFRNVQEPNFVTTNKVNTECRIFNINKADAQKILQIKS